MRNIFGMECAFQAEEWEFNNLFNAWPGLDIHRVRICFPEIRQFRTEDGRIVAVIRDGVDGAPDEYFMESYIRVGFDKVGSKTISTIFNRCGPYWFETMFSTDNGETWEMVDSYLTLVDAREGHRKAVEQSSGIGVGP